MQEISQAMEFKELEAFLFTSHLSALCVVLVILPMLPALRSVGKILTVCVHQETPSACSIADPEIPVFHLICHMYGKVFMYLPSQYLGRL